MAVSVFPVPSNVVDPFAPPGAVQKVFEGSFKTDLGVTLGPPGRYAVVAVSTQKFASQMYFANQAQDLAYGLRSGQDCLTFETFRPEEHIRFGFQPSIRGVYAPGSTTPYIGDTGHSSTSFAMPDNQFTTGAGYRMRNGRWLAARTPASGVSTTAIASSDSLLPLSTSDWTLRTTPSARYTCFAQLNNGTVVVAGWLGAIASSTDGVTWTARTSNMGTTDIYSIATNGTMLIVAGVNGANISRSTDGINWTSSNVGTDNNLEIMFTNGQWVLTKSSTSVYFTSPDGITWTQRASATTRSGSDRSHRFLNGSFYQAASFGSNSFAVSTDGVVWQSQVNQANRTTMPTHAFFGYTGQFASASANTNIRVTANPEGPDAPASLGTVFVLPRAISGSMPNSSAQQYYFSGSMGLAGSTLNTGAGNNQNAIASYDGNGQTGSIAIYRLA